MYITNKVQEFEGSNTMNMQDIIYLNSANLYVTYDCDIHIYNLCVNINGYKLALFTTTNINYQLDDSTLGYMVEVIDYFQHHATPNYDVNGLNIIGLQEKFSDCLILEPRHSKVSSSTVAIDIIYCDSNNEDNYICSIPDLSFRFSDEDMQAISCLIDEFAHGDN